MRHGTSLTRSGISVSYTHLAEGSVTNLKTDLKTEGDGKVYNISFDYAASGLRYKYAVNAAVSYTHLTNVIRLLPPITLSDTEIEKGVAILSEIFD